MGRSTILSPHSRQHVVYNLRNVFARLRVPHIQIVPSIGLVTRYRLNYLRELGKYRMFSTTPENTHNTPLVTLLLWAIETRTMGSFYFVLCN
ncbi:hypothetical protein O9992_27100 [Vibrio lentus]|nr:hypothetical protein [Vibrio lentus]